MRDSLKLIPIVLIIFLFGIWCGIMGNEIWANSSKSFTLWEDAVCKSPNKYRPHLNLSAQFMKEKNYAMALAVSQRAMKIKPDDIASYVNAASSAISLQAWQLAYNYSHEAMKRRPMKEVAHNLIVICGILGKPEEQKEWIRKIDSLPNAEDVSHRIERTL